MKKPFANIITAVICATALMFGTASAAPAGQVKLGVVSVNYNSPSIQVQTDAAIAAAKKRGWKVQLFNGRGDQAATNNAAINFINRGFDAILNTASTNQQMTKVIAYAKKHHVPYVSTFSGYLPGVVADVGSNNVVDGAISATELMNLIHAHGHIVKMDWTVLPALAERDRGFEAVIAGYPNVKVTRITLKVPGQVHDAFTKMSSLLLKYHDIVGVWCGWDEPCYGVVHAIKEAGKADDIVVVGLNGDAQAIDAIRSGGPFKATVAYDEKGMGVEAVEVIAHTLGGTPPQNPIVTLKSCLITKDTAPPKGQPVDFSTCKLYLAGSYGQK